MKKLVLVAILGLGFLMMGCATTHTAKTDEVSSTAEKTDEMSSSATKSGEFETKNLSNKQVNQLFIDCVNNKNKNSCQRLTDSKLPSVEQCDKETCSDIGRVYDIAQNYQQALKYYKKACELNDGFGCGGLATLYLQGQGVEQDFAEAFKFNKKACDLNSMGACYNIGVHYTEGQGVMQDFVNAKKYHEKACNKNFAWACNNLGALYIDGRGVKQNKSTAKKYYGKACDLGNQKGCDNYRKLNEQGVK